MIHTYIYVYICTYISNLWIGSAGVGHNLSWMDMEMPETSTQAWRTSIHILDLCFCQLVSCVLQSSAFEKLPTSRLHGLRVFRVSLALLSRLCFQLLTEGLPDTQCAPRSRPVAAPRAFELDDSATLCFEFRFICFLEAHFAPKLCFFTFPATKTTFLLHYICLNSDHQHN